MFSKVDFTLGTGHPDKISDFIADKILDYLLRKDLWAKLDAEVSISNNLVLVQGFWNSSKVKEIDIEAIVKEAFKELNLDSEKVTIQNLLEKKELNNNYTTVSVGYACDQTVLFLPLPYTFLRDLNNRLQSCIKREVLEGAKYNYAITAILQNEMVSHLFIEIEHDKEVDINDLKVSLYRKALLKSLERYGLFLVEEKKNIVTLEVDPNNRIGFSNKRLSMDSYGFSTINWNKGLSGKDLSRPERLGAYYARWIAKNLVASNVCSSVELNVIFLTNSTTPIFIVKDKVSIHSISSLTSCIRAIFDFTYEEIYKLFNVPNILFSDLSRYGHFFNSNLPWESLDKVQDIKNYLYGN